MLPAFSPSRDGLDGLLRTAGVPVWLPWPLPAGWFLAGFAWAWVMSAPVSAPARWRCRARTRSAAPLTWWSSPRNRVSAWARDGPGLDSVDPGAGFATAPPVATASFGKHDFALWQVDSPDLAVFAGEIKGYWLWLVLWPETAGVLLVEPIALRDLRDPGQDLDLPFGAASVRLPAN